MPDPGNELEDLAEALYLECEYSAAALQYERAYAAHRRAGAEMAAGRAARAAAWITGNVLGDWAVQNGWLARARTILEEAGGDRPERGWVLIIRSISEPDPKVREATLREAMAVGRRFGDPDIEFEALGYLGGLFIMTDRVEEGLAFLDEMMAAVCAGEMTEVTEVDRLFCGFFWACELVNDVPRADQWMRAAADLMSRRKFVAAFCRAHYGGILTAAGRWAEAETELLAASSHFEREVSTRREAALIRLGDLRVRQGRLEDAAELLTGLEAHPDAVRALAGLYFARAETARRPRPARTGHGKARRSVPEVGGSTMVGPLLALLVDVHLAEGDIDAAARAAARLRRIADAQGQRVPASRCRPRRGAGVHRERDRETRAPVCTTPWTASSGPRCRWSSRAHAWRWRASLAESSPEVAVAEAKLALEGFERLEAARHADAAAQMLRSLGAPARTGPKGVGALTKREAEVLQLIGAGLSNPEIADRLYIARKTVEHHVGRVLTKLGLRNRAEAAALATREQIRPVDRGPPRCSTSAVWHPRSERSRIPAAGTIRHRARGGNMGQDRYDAIVVGARCAGSPTAMLLARKGYEVLVVDRATFPSDTLSTHILHPPAVEAMQRWGLLDRLVATGCPPIDTYSFDFGPFTLSGAPGTEAAPLAYCPRRTVLDKLLVDAASEAGAEVREGFTVQEIVVEDDRVVGIRGHGKDGATVTERADVVVGADGRNSFVAKAVHPEQYNEKPPLLCAYYTLLERTADGRPLRRVHPARPWLRGGAHARRPHAA